MAEEQKNTIYNVRVTAEDALKTLAELKLRSQELRDQQKALGKVTEENARTNRRQVYQNLEPSWLWTMPSLQSWATQ